MARHLPAQIARLRSLYREKRDGFLRAPERHFTELATWNRPAGRMFLLLRLLGGSQVLPRSRSSRGTVAYVPSSLFFPAGGGEDTMRLCFVSAALAEIDDGVARWAKVIKA